MQSSDPDHFFETNATQLQRERRAAKAVNSHGNPMRLKSKINAVIADPHSPSSVFIAESAGRVRRLDLRTQKEVAVYRGPTDPVTSLAAGGRNNQILFAGSWDKHIWSWDITSAKPNKKYDGHTDFVKAVVCARLSGIDVLISGGADKKIIVWNINTGARLHTLQDPTITILAIQHLAIDPVLTTPDTVILVSASSDPHIRRWRVTADKYERISEEYQDKPGAERPTIKEHETSVYKLVFDDHGDDADLLSASADGTVKCLSRSKKFVPEDVYHHRDHVRAVVSSDLWLISAGRDEDIKVWNRSSGKLYCKLKGHYDEVTDLVTLRDNGGEAETVCSVSLDGTVRTWPLKKSELDKVLKEIQDSSNTGKREETGMTADEEAELSALMEEI